MATGAGLLTAENLLRMPDDDMRHELVAGVLTTMPPPKVVHGVCASRIATALSIHVRERRLGVTTTEVGFTLARDPDTVRAPDVSFIARARIPADGLPPAYWEGAPDLAIEVLSPDDRPSEVREKVSDYLAAGGVEVWVVRPRARTVTVHTRGVRETVLGEQDVLESPVLLRGFAYPLSELFEGLARR